ncbi:hypothetical protein B9Z55_027722 [Caenorhabditis nigoni]|uniref:DNA-directed DNA polymerase n=1 Tax=Caenorhabditis nigoni TaxID=1611254 RepID=A0A2G5SEY4_9PELO|nr:hypothetical protein B9Z55_027722 [Caenorhabditis nigoni]
MEEKTKTVQEVVRNATVQEEEIVQVGGASLKVTNKVVSKGLERFKDSIENVILDLDIPANFTSSPNGAELFGDAIVDLVNRYVPSGMVAGNLKTGVKFESPEITKGVGLSFKPLSKVSSRDVVACMEAMAQSNKSPLELDVPKITVHITYLNPPSGSGDVASEEGGGVSTDRPAVGRKRKSFGIEDILALPTKNRREGEESEEEEEELGNINFEDLDEEVQPKGRHIMKNNVTRNCLPHAIYQVLTAYEYANDRQNMEKKLKHRRSLTKKETGRDCCSDVFAAVAEMKKKAGITKSTDFDCLDVAQFQEKCFAGQFQIIVFAKNSTLPYYAGPFVGKGKQLALYLADGHYSGLRSICALLKTNYYCSLCHVRYRDASTHYACRGIHRPCGRDPCPVTPNDEKKECTKCFVTFRSVACYENHLKKGVVGNGRSRCEYTKYCQKCKTSYYFNKNNRKHVCGGKYCHRCQVEKLDGHKCTMMPSIKNEKNLTRKRGFFDIESRRCPDTGKQIPVLFKCLKCCPRCSDEIPKTLEQAKNEKCQNCSPDGRLKIIESISSGYVDVAEEMTKWMFDDKHRGFVFVAHNASGYDGQFILENLIASNKVAPEVCLDGTKLIFLKLNEIRMIDSLKYLTMSLSAVGKTFQVDSVKGDFPVLFIQPENYGYSGPIPENKYYGLENKSPTARKQLEEFLEKERADESVKFNFFKEICKYCYNDVYMLSVAMTKFEKAFEAMTNVCLLEETTTAASAAALVFRRNHLDEEKPIVLDAKPSVSINNSILSQKYLAWVSSSEDVQVNMSTTYGEKKIGGYRVDGYIPPCEKYKDGLIIEFFGCYHHAHICSYSEESVIAEKQARDIWQADKERIQKLEEVGGCPVRVVYECQVKESLRTDSEMKEFFDNYEALDLLQCERALVGGRTEVFRLHANCDGRVGHYLDVVSLYPTVMKHEAYPIGEPENVQRNTMKTPMTKPEDIPFEGFLSCRLDAPKNLKLPVIAGKVNGRLMFFLCRKCAKDGNQDDCQHSDEERAFTGTFTTVELKKALSLGYWITQVYHGVKYEKWVKNEVDGEGGLFTSYINSMMKEKIYSSGWPKNVQSEEDKKIFIAGYKEKEAITLDPSLFESNAGKRAVAKLMLNSLWGKFAQRVDRQNTEIIIDPGKFWALVHDSSLEIRDVRPVNSVLVVQYRQKEETLSSLKTSAIHLAAYTTAHARLRLYRLMELVGPENICYTDTDSIIFTTPEGDLNPLETEQGPYLGQLTNELSGVMSEFVTLGPKTYAYKETLSNGEEKVVVKAKGITINSEVEKKLNFERMKAMMQEVLQQVAPRTALLLPQHVMTRDKDHRVYSRNIVKTFKYTFNKRRLLSDGTTLPFGFSE